MSYLIDQDQQHRQLALDASKSFIVQAPAGSGKTELLIQRFLTLLTLVKMPEEILAITFTKKAANEMRARVIKALKKALTESEPTSSHTKQTWHLAKQVLLRDRQFNWNLIDNPNQLRIQTIDSLCSYLTKQLPLLSNFGSSPLIADYPIALYREAVQEVLAHVEENYEWSQAIADLLLHLDNDLNKLHDLIINLLAKRDQWLPYIQLNTHTEDIRLKLENQLALVISDCLCAIREKFPETLANELIAMVRYAANNLAIDNVSSDIIACKDMQALPGIQAKDKKLWQGLSKLLLTSDDAWRKSFDVRNGFPAAAHFKNPNEKQLAKEHKQRITTLMEQLYPYEDFRIALAEINKLPEACYQDSQWEILKSLLVILKIVAAQLRLTFQQHGRIDFIENAQAALSALGNDEHPTDLALALDYQIQHILVDEFQDTSYTQYQLLEKLTAGWETNDGRTLFVVGDPMQSIYRFREAEVGLFIRMRKRGIGHLTLHPLTLAVNFRSSHSIVEWNNKHFKPIFPLFNDMATGAVAYSASVSHQAQSSADENTDIQIQGFANATEEIQANHIIHLIQQLKANDPNKTIAILVRSRAHLASIIPALKNAKIPYRAVDIDALASKQIIQDLLSLCCAMLHPADRISWLAILRAPWCGLTLADLFMIANENAYATIWEQLENPQVMQRLSVDGQQRLAQFFPVLKNKMMERERHNLRYWIESTWFLLGGPACLSDETEIEDANAFFTLLENFTQDQQLLNLDKLKEKINQLYASTQDETNLQIMTIHTAKGLEFDSVILPHLEKKLPHDDKSLLSWMEQPLTNDQVALLLAPIHATGNEKDALYEYIQYRQKIKSSYEIDRLFYVATTRAKNSLHLFFNVEHKEEGHIRIESGSFLEKLWPFLEKQKDHIIISEVNTLPSDIAAHSAQRYIKRLPVNWKNPIQEIASTTVSSHQQNSGFQLSENKAQWIGVVTHHVLQYIANLSFIWWQKKTSQQQFVYLKQQLAQLGMLEMDQETACQIIHKSIEQTLRDERGQWILQAHQEAKSEFALTAIINEQIENMVIDRTFIDEHGTRWIIDYKTATLNQDGLEQFLHHEQEKYVEQMNKYYQAMKLIEDRPIKLGLYFPALPAWKEWDAN